MKAISHFFSAASMLILSFGSSLAERPGLPPSDIVKELRLVGTNLDMLGLSKAEFSSASPEKLQAAAPLDSVPVLEPASAKRQKNTENILNEFVFFLGINSAAPTAERLAELSSKGHGNGTCCILPTQCGMNGH